MVLDGVPHSISAFSKTKSSFGHRRTTRKETFTFAASAVAALVQSCPASICDGLVRVDIFTNASGLLVVNEFESLEAEYGSTEQNEIEIHNFLVAFWEKHLRSALPAELFAACSCA